MDGRGLLALLLLAVLATAVRIHTSHDPRKDDRP